MKGQFIVVEGLEGAGKSTAMHVVSDWLHDRGVMDVTLTREPGGTSYAEKVRDLVKNGPRDETLDPLAEALLMYAARVQLVRTVIEPTLARGGFVISDRHELSTRAYQGGGGGIKQTTLQTLWSLVLDGFTPDLTIYLDLPPQQGLKRVAARGALDSIEQRPLSFFEKVYEVYHAYAQSDPKIFCVDATQDLKKVHEDLLHILNTQVRLI